jgi:hypothetical protein
VPYPRSYFGFGKARLSALTFSSALSKTSHTGSLGRACLERAYNLLPVIVLPSKLSTLVFPLIREIADGGTELATFLC